MPANGRRDLIRRLKVNRIFVTFNSPHMQSAKCFLNKHPLSCFKQRLYAAKKLVLDLFKWSMAPVLSLCLQASLCPCQQGQMVLVGGIIMSTFLFIRLMILHASLLITTLTAACSRPCVTAGYITEPQFITIMSHGRLHQRPPVHYKYVTWQATSRTPQFITNMSRGRLHQRPPSSLKICHVAGYITDPNS